MPKIIIFLILALIVLSVGASGYYMFGPDRRQPADNFTVRENKKEIEKKNHQNDEEVKVIAEGLDIPWEIAFLPDDGLLVTQRTGSVKRINKNGREYNIEGVEHVGEGGLLGMALHPDFTVNRWIYFYFTTRHEDALQNKVVRYRLEDDSLSDREVILEGIPGAQFHDGGRLAFSPDGYLFIATGDASRPNLSQDTASLAGKILRINDDGSIPDDNPFDNEVYSYGHRNSQGMAWDNQGRLWATEHGPRGHDELNLIEAGKNYGWPTIQGDRERGGMESPVIHSGTDTWAPAGAAFWRRSIFFGGLRGESIFEARLDSADVVSLERHFENEFGRIRTIVIGPDGYMYITTNNTDGRGRPRSGDDKIIRINPGIFP